MELSDLDRVERLLDETRSGIGELAASIGRLAHAVNLVSEHVDTSDQLSALLGEFSRHVREEARRFNHVAGVSDEVAELVARYGDRGEDMAEFVTMRAREARKVADRLSGVCGRVDSTVASEPDLRRHVKGGRRDIERMASALRDFDLDRRIRRRLPSARRETNRRIDSEQQAEQETRQMHEDVNELIKVIQNL